MANGNNPFGDWLSGGNWGSLMLAQMPQAAYLSHPTGQDFTRTPSSGAYSPRRGRFQQQAYQDIYGDYLGSVGTALREGEEPSTFDEFLYTNPWTARYGRLPQSARGVTGMATNPRTRFLFNY